MTKLAAQLKMDMYALGGRVMQVVSADQFVDGLIAALFLQGKREIDLDNQDLDEQFARAYEELLDNAETLGVVPDFVMTANRNYGDSTCLRDTLLAMRDLRSIALKNPRFVRLEILMKGQPPDVRLQESQIPRNVLEELAQKHLSKISA